MTSTVFVFLTCYNVLYKQIANYDQRLINRLLEELILITVTVN